MPTTGDAPELVSYFASLPSDVRRDVALVACVLQDHGGSMGAHELGKLVAQRAERPVLWGVAAVEAAVAAARPRAMAYRRGEGLHPVVAMTPETAISDAEQWTEAASFALPRDPEALANRIGRLLGDPTFTLTFGQAGVVLALADLGGSATVEELHNLAHSDRRATVQALTDLRCGGWKAPWLVNEGSGRRVRLASRLWP